MLTKEVQDKVYQAYKETIKLPTDPEASTPIKFRKYCGMYVFTTENIHQYFRKLRLQGKSVLTVTSSGDHLINLALAGVNSIHNFDINENAYYMTQLKLAALKTLEYEEFLQFFTDSEDRKIVSTYNFSYYEKINENPFAFDYRTYLHIRQNLKEDCALYWDMLYEEYHFDGLALMQSGILYGKDSTFAIYNNQYLQNEKEYLKTREAIEHVDIEFFSMDVFELYKLPYVYDVILLSNIYEYVTSGYSKDNLEESFNKYVTEELTKKLTEDGLISMAYKYNYKMKNNAYKRSLKNLFNSGTKWVIEQKESLERFASKKILVPSVNREFRATGAKDCIYFCGVGRLR